MRRTPFGHRQGTMVNGVWTPTSDDYSNKAALIAQLAAERVDGDVYQLADGSSWQYVAAGTASDASQNLILTPYDAPGVYVRQNDTIDLSAAFGFGTADATALFTVPTNARIFVRRGYWQVTIGFTGGASSAIGLNSSNATYNTKGDLLGGAGGDVAATLVVGACIPGTIGAKTAAGIFLNAGDTVKFDQITSAFTAGAGFAHLICDILANPGL
jgi:hypothetical protein